MEIKKGKTQAPSMEILDCAAYVIGDEIGIIIPIKDGFIEKYPYIMCINKSIRRHHVSLIIKYN